MTTPLTNNIAGNLSPSIEGDIVAWQTKLPAGPSWPTTSRPGHRGQVSAQGDTVGYPDVDGNIIAWFGTKGLYYAVPSSEATRFPDVPADHPYARPSRAWPNGRSSRATITATSVRATGHAPAIRQDDRAHHGFHRDRERYLHVRRRGFDRPHRPMTSTPITTWPRPPSPASPKVTPTAPSDP